MYLEPGILLVEHERDGYKLILVVGIDAGHHNTGITNTHLSPHTLGHGVDSKQMVAPILGKNGEEV